VAEEREVNGKAYGFDARGRALSRDAVRILRETPRPDDVEAGEPWIHVNLDEQTLVAYAGDEAVFGTLIASGKEGYDTPVESYRVRNK